MAAPEPMTPEKAKLILKDTILVFSQPENQARLQAALAEVAQLPPEQRGAARIVAASARAATRGLHRRRGRPGTRRGGREVTARARREPPSRRQPMAKMGKLIPIVTELAGGKLADLAVNGVSISTKPADTSMEDFLKSVADESTAGGGMLVDCTATEATIPALLAAAGSSLDDALGCRFFLRKAPAAGYPDALFAGFLKTFNQDHPPPPTRAEFVAASLDLEHEDDGVEAKPEVVVKCDAAVGTADR